MKKYDLRFTRWAGVTWLVLAILVGCVAPATEETATVQPVAATMTMTTVTPSPTFALSPTLSPTMTTETTTFESSIPLCTFVADDVPKVAGPSLDDYVFSEPQVVLTHTSAIGIVDWLPDSEQLLVVRSIPGTGRQSIETLDVHTGKTHLYAEREGANGKPVWLSVLGSVAYSTFTGQKHELYTSNGDPAQVEQIAQNVDGLSLSAESDGQHLLYFPSSVDTQLQVWNSATKKVQITPLSLTQSFQTDWSPTNSQVILYAYQRNPLLLNFQTNRLCEVNLEQSKGEPRWVFYTQWSPDGRYLAMITTSDSMQIRSNELTVFDVVNGKSHFYGLSLSYLYDIAWHSNSKTLAVLGQIDVINGSALMGLYLVDVARGNFLRMLPQYTFGGGAIEGWQLAWSPNGHTLSVKCPIWLETEPTINEDRVCLITSSLQP